MALIPIFHVVAAERDVAAGQLIKEGMVVSLNAAGQIQVPDTTYKIPYGLAGDSKLTSASSMPGISAGWQNRASDYFDETKASSKMTVYHSGGEFITDQFDANVAALTFAGASLQPLYALAGGLLSSADTNTSGVVVARLVKVCGAEMSGVPGVDINGDQALASDAATSTGSSTYANTYIEIKLVI
jgi:hypothetical protein